MVNFSPTDSLTIVPTKPVSLNDLDCSNIGISFEATGVYPLSSIFFCLIFKCVSHVSLGREWLNSSNTGSLSGYCLLGNCGRGGFFASLIQWSPLAASFMPGALALPPKLEKRSNLWRCDLCGIELGMPESYVGSVGSSLRVLRWEASWSESKGRYCF